MKKVLLLVIIGLVCTGSLSAQSVPKSIFGIKFGMNQSIQYFSDSEMTALYRTKGGFHIGASYEILLDEAIPFTIETGVYFSTKGFKNNHGEVNLNYMEFPLLLGYMFYEGGDFAVKPFAGLNFATGLKGKEVYDSRVYDNLFDDILKKGDVGIRVGMGMYINKRVFASASYEWGMTNIYKNSTFKLCNRNFMLTIGFLF